MHAAHSCTAVGSNKQLQWLQQRHHCWPWQLQLGSSWQAVLVF
jgi:hypothetical protein